ncbi:MAG TPA: chromate transporter, partial [Acidimicrobiales bacterium]|nr:chromate transporter [Acidimicrobiales bacterium]
EGAAGGAGAAVPAVALHAAGGLIPTSWGRAGSARARRARWVVYVAAGALAAATIGPWLVLVLAGCGLCESALRARPGPSSNPNRHPAGLPLLVVPAVATGGLAAVAWVALKVGALSYGGGFVIVPLMQHDAVNHYHWMTGNQFLNAVALGQVTPGPVVLTVAVVGYAAAGLRGGLLAALSAFTPSFVFVLLGARRFDQIRSNARIQGFLGGAGPAAIGAIAGSAIPLALALTQSWQAAVLAAAAVWLLGFRRGVVSSLLGAGALGMVIVLAGAPIHR